MKRNGTILFLGSGKSPLLEWLIQEGETVRQTLDEVTVDFVTKLRVSFLVSYNYRRIVTKDVLDVLKDRAVNLHISYLPWNRGCDPNLWSFVDGTPHGVTIHYMDEGVDTGDVIMQKKVAFLSGEETLATSYETLHEEIQALFKSHWKDIKTGKCSRRKQSGEGSFHKLKDKDSFFGLLPHGWNTPVSALSAYTEAAKKKNSLAYGPKTTKGKQV